MPFQITLTGFVDIEVFSDASEFMEVKEAVKCSPAERQSRFKGVH